ncbi:hypothetical protein FA13DRAFT_1790911 [Coprinellus micaceus]|uniref:Uncharacterized protein n=1 Tax=Coprinellus micaceus TaxID=71717 RepID=A0A4Y7TER8_COPMI|nr:hypothetical protein FA13DRAFT_1790911 [Coprinellus micaceus]
MTPYESQWFINYLSSRLRAAAFEYKTLTDECLKSNGREFRELLWRDVVWTHAIVGFIGLRHPPSVEPPPFYKGLTLLGVQLNFNDAVPIPQNELLALLMATSSMDQDIELYVSAWWKDYELKAAKGKSSSRGYEDSVIAGWEQQRKVFPKPKTLCALRTSSVAAHIDTLSIKELHTASSSIVRFEDALRLEMRSTLRSMRRVWTEIQRFDILIRSLENPNLSPPHLNLDAPPTDTFNLKS